MSIQRLEKSRSARGLKILGPRRGVLVNVVVTSLFVDHRASTNRPAWLTACELAQQQSSKTEPSFRSCLRHSDELGRCYLALTRNS